MDGITAKYWEGKTPSPEYFLPPNPTNHVQIATSTFTNYVSMQDRQVNV